MDDQFTPDEMNTIEELKATPRPKINPSRARSIHEQVIHEFRTSPPSPVVRYVLPRGLVLRAIAGLAAIAIIVLVVSQIGNQQTRLPGTATVLPTSNQIAALPSATDTSNVITSSPTLTSILEVSSSPVATIAVVATTPVATQSALESSPTATPLEAIVVVEGQVSNIVGNVITVNGFDIEVAPNHPILQIIDVGDAVHVEGELSDDGMIAPTIISNLSDTITSGASTLVTVGLDGPVEAINGNTVMVNGIPVQFPPNDPILQNLQVGNFVSVQGNFVVSGTTIVLAVVNVTVFNNITIINNTCWFEPAMGEPAMGMEDPAMGIVDDGMGMGHWHCDGMGMGEPAMGMADDGMGEPAMGMGG